MQNHAFIIQAHTQPELLDRILSRLNAPNHYFFINIDGKIDFGKFEKIVAGGGYNVCYVSRLSVYYCGFSMIATTLHLLEAVKRSKITFDYVHSISGQDYPVVGNEAFDARMESANGYSFMWYDRDEEHARWIIPGGYYERRYRWWCLSREKVRIPYMRKVLGKFDQYSRKFLVRKRIEGIRAGWSWFTWHVSVMNFVLEYMNTHPDYLKRFHHTYCCDELIFHTLLYPHLDKLKIQKDNALRYIEWHPKRAYSGKLPLLLEDTEYVEITRSGALFCRKVDGVQSEKLLNMLDNTCNA